MNKETAHRTAGPRQEGRGLAHLKHKITIHSFANIDVHDQIMRELSTKTQVMAAAGI